MRDDEDEENILTTSLNDFEAVMHQWEEQDVHTEEQQPNNLEKEQQQQRTSEHANQILAYKAQVGTVERKRAALGGGRTGGWDARDHDSFLRIYTQCCPDISKSDLSAAALRNLMKKLKPMLPGSSEGEIATHVTWYREMLSLLSEKKELLRKWQHEKSTSETLQLTLDGGDDSVPISVVA